MSHIIRPKKKSNVRKRENEDKASRLHDQYIREIDNKDHRIRQCINRMIDYDPVYVMRILETMGQLDLYGDTIELIKLSEELCDKILTRLEKLVQFIQMNDYRVAQDVKLELIALKHLSEDSTWLKKALQKMARRRV